mmetsp:Transcript_5185/g.12990  ORF Transcript_5185/g.12990 Transcript_5185/m.12990 type:complete len:311 (-) Transcript_5185:46-978(-)
MRRRWAPRALRTQSALFCWARSCEGRHAPPRTAPTNARMPRRLSPRMPARARRGRRRLRGHQVRAAGITPRRRGRYATGESVRHAATGRCGRRHGEPQAPPPPAPLRRACSEGARVDSIPQTPVQRRVVRRPARCARRLPTHASPRGAWVSRPLAAPCAPPLPLRPPSCCPLPTPARAARCRAPRTPERPIFQHRLTTALARSLFLFLALALCLVRGCPYPPIQADLRDCPHTSPSPRRSPPPPRRRPRLRVLGWRAIGRAPRQSSHRRSFSSARPTPPTAWVVAVRMGSGVADPIPSSAVRVLLVVRGA